jgi:hypothetical protein
VIVPAAESSQSAATEAPLQISMLALYGAALLVLVLGALTTTRPFLRWLRQPLVAALVGAGWVWVIFGVAIGPYGANLLGTPTVESLRPLMLVGLGFVGLTVGLQLDLRMLRAVPAPVWRWATLDTAVCIAAGAAIVLSAGPFWLRVDATSGAWLAMPTAVLAATLIGWNPETRSLLARGTSSQREAARLTTGTAGLCTAIAVILVGVASQLIVRGSDGVPTVSLKLGAVALAAALGLALCALVAIRVLLQRGDWSSSRTLIVVLSTSALATGVAAELSFSPLLATLFCGAAIANLPSSKLRFSVWRLLSRSERAVATVFFIVAGALLAPPASGWGWVGAFIGACVAIRMLGKPIVMRLALGRTLEPSGEGSTPLRRASTRQSAIALVIAVAAVLSEDSAVRRELLLVVAISGALCAAWPLVKRRKARPGAVEARA